MLAQRIPHALAAHQLDDPPVGLRLDEGRQPRFAVHGEQGFLDRVAPALEGGPRGQFRAGQRAQVGLERVEPGAVRRPEGGDREAGAGHTIRFAL